MTLLGSLKTTTLVVFFTGLPQKAELQKAESRIAEIQKAEFLPFAQMAERLKRPNVLKVRMILEFRILLFIELY